MSHSSTSSTPHGAPDWDLIARVLAGEASAEQTVEVLAWLDAHPGDARLAATLDALVDGASVGPAMERIQAAAGLAPVVDTEHALAAVKGRIDAAAPVTARPRLTVAPGGAARSGPARPWARRASFAAAGLAAAALLAVGVERWRSDPAETASGDGGAVLAAGGMRATGVGIRDSLRLPDGTRVILAPGSRLDVKRGYGEGAREVTLAGAAWFHVVHDDARPFTVRAGHALVRDLGTAFTVRTDGAEGVAISVHEGVVSLRHASRLVAAIADTILRAGDHGTVREDGAIATARGAASPDDIAWVAGRLVFRDAPFETVRADVRRWYGLDLRAGDPTLAARRLTASFEHEPASRVLEVIALALGADVTRTGNVVTLRPVAPGAR